MANLTPETLNSIIREYVTETVQQEERSRAAATRKLNPDTYDEKIFNIEEGISWFKERLAYGEHGRLMKPEAEEAAERHQLTNLDGDDYQLLCFKLHQAAIKAQEVVLKHWQPGGVSSADSQLQQPERG